MYVKVMYDCIILNDRIDSALRLACHYSENFWFVEVEICIICSVNDRRDSISCFHPSAHEHSVNELCPSQHSTHVLGNENKNCTCTEQTHTKLATFSTVVFSPRNHMQSCA